MIPDAEIVCLPLGFSPRTHDPRHVASLLSILTTQPDQDHQRGLRGSWVTGEVHHQAQLSEDP